MAKGGILIVDDNEINREICALNLEELDISLHFADNGITGLQCAIEVEPDLILLDIMMPEMDGFEMLHHLNRHPTLQEIPVLMLTAKAETESIVRALEAGANDYLRKPFAEEEMVARVKTLLRNRLLEKQVRQDIIDGAAIQKKFLTDAAATTTLLKHVAIESAVFNQPYATVSGDFFFAFQRHNEALLFLGDSCGHGLPAALISMRILGCLQQLSQLPYSPKKLLDILNKDITGLLPVSKFVAASCLSFTNNSCILSNAAQSYPLVLRKDTIEEIVLDGLPLGINNAYTYQETEFSFNSGDCLVLYTDGVVEATDDNDTLYDKRRLLECIKTCGDNTEPEEILTHIKNDLITHRGSAQLEDDQTLIVLKKQ